MARRALFLWVVLGLVLAGSVVLAKVLVDAGEVVASPAAATTSVADSETILPLVDNEGSNGLPICTYPDNCPPPESVDCMIQVRAFGTVIGVDDSQGEPIRFFDPN